MDSPQAQREKYWDEKNAGEQIDKLAEVVEILGRRIIQLEKEMATLSQHAHNPSGEIVVPLVRSEVEHPWFMKHLLGRRP